MKRRLFGTDGIRGEAGVFPLDQDTVKKVGAAIALSMQNGGHQLKVAIGRDTRESGSWISKALLEALISCEVEAVWDLGVITTPGLAFLTRRHEFDVGIMISASHNPYQDNGIKVFSSEGTKLSDEKELQIEGLVFNEIPPSLPTILRAKRARIVHAEDRSEEYVAFLASQVDVSLSKFRVGLDVAQGAAFSIAPRLFRRLGAEVEVINDQPDGKNINHNCGSLHLDRLRQLVCDKRIGLWGGIRWRCRSILVRHGKRKDLRWRLCSLCPFARSPRKESIESELCRRNRDDELCSRTRP